MSGVSDVTVLFDAYDGNLVEGVTINILKSKSESGPYFVIGNVTAASVSYVDHFGSIGDWYCVSEVISGYDIGQYRDYQRGYVDTMSFMVDEIRRLINDTKFTWTHIVREELGTANGANLEERFEVDYLPMAGYDYFLWVDRYPYEPIATSGHLVTGRRQYIPDIPNGRFVISHCNDSGTVYANYIWGTPRQYKFSDHELKLYMKDSIAEVNNLIDGSDIATTGYGSSLQFSESPTSIQARLIILLSSIYALKALQETMSLNAIYVKDGQTSIDTTKSLGSRKESIRDLESRINALVENQVMIQQLDEVCRLDTYSTSTETGGLISVGTYMETNRYEVGPNIAGYQSDSGISYY